MVHYMKRSITAFLLSLVLILSLAGCNEKKAASPSSQPSATMFSLTDTQAVLYDNATAFLLQQNDSEVFLPVLSIVGTFVNEAGNTCYVLNCDQYIFFGLEEAMANNEDLTQERPGFPGQSVLWMCVEMGTDGKVVSVKASEDGNTSCTDTIQDICGPLTELADTIISGSSPSVTGVFPDMEPMEMLQLYVDAQE